MYAQWKFPYMFIRVEIVNTSKKAGLRGDINISRNEGPIALCRRRIDSHVFSAVCVVKLAWCVLFNMFSKGKTVFLSMEEKLNGNKGR
jgi:hypothetical protein